MARTPIPAARVSRSGLDLKTATNGQAGDVANGNVVEGNDGLHLVVVVANTHGSTSYGATFITTATVGEDALAVPDVTKTLAAGEVKAYGPWPLAEYGKSLQIDPENAALKFQAVYI